MRYTKINEKHDTLIYPLGGLGEVGRNMACFEYRDEIIIVDCGVLFPDESSLGIDYIISDFRSLRNKKNKYLLITHGHEDHIGAIPYLLKNIEIKAIYASSFANALIRKKLVDRKMFKECELLRNVDNTSTVKTKYFNCGFFNITHSIPDSMGIVINTPNGRIVHTGDYKFDLTPLGNNSDYQVLSFLGYTGVDVLMADSTNSEVNGFSISEKDVAKQIDKIFKNTKKRLIIATFASNVNRVSQIINIASKYNRKIAIFGRSMENVIQIGREMGKINISEKDIVDGYALKTIKDGNLCIICTGSQGEPLAALNRIANGEHRFVKLKSTDTVVFSSSPIPGNGESVNAVVNKLWKRGANVLTKSILNNLHTTGHASSDEQKLLFQLTKPKYFIPIHGEYKMLEMHAKTAAQVGVPLENSAVISNGDVLVLRNKELLYTGTRVDAEDVFISGDNDSGLSSNVIKDKKILNNNGVVAVIVNIDSYSKKVLNKPMILTRGFIYTNDAQDLIKNAEKIVTENLTNEIHKEKTTFAKIKDSIKKPLEAFFYAETHRNPIVVPVVLNINEKN